MKKENKLEKKTSLGLPDISQGIKIGGVLFAGLFLYGLGVLETGGETNPFNWNEAQEQIRVKSNQKNYRKQFHDLDKNKDYIIDSTEFIYRNR